ncbi:MAG TPA: FlgD immunoglobulin-like domain containing protein, partial [bacterium]|nr:FlgD immunoglobulin-like domain containing protein [bacterium]
GQSDVDNGHTTLLSPVFDASGFGDLTLRYQRWFSNRAPAPTDNDEFRADVSSDGGMSWVNMETVDVGTDSWAQVEIDLTSLVAATSEMQLRFVAEDLGASHYVEGGVDEVEIITSVTGAVTPAGTESSSSGVVLAPPAPNPFREGTVVQFRTPSAGAVRVVVHDVGGRRVAVLLNSERLAAGEHRVSWNGTGSDGRRAAPGVYFIRVSAAGTVASAKVALTR